MDKKLTGERRREREAESEWKDSQVARLGGGRSEGRDGERLSQALPRSEARVEY